MTDQSSQASGESTGSRKQDLASPIPVVGIGASAGGLEAFKTFFEKMPSDSGMAFVLIPHLDPLHKSLMDDIVGRHTAMPTVQVDKRMTIAPNHVYIVPPNRNLTIEKGQLVPHAITRTRGINLPVDFFFRSLAAHQNKRAIGVILSGTMSDGATGLKEIKARGGLVIAQTPATAEHDGMPRSAINTGMVDLALPIEEMPDAIVKFITHPYIHRDARVRDEEQLNQVLAVIHARSRNDFRWYKRNTLIRRTERRMGLRQVEKMADYVEILKNEPRETDALLKDLLIGVTDFFREEQVWKKVGADILPPLVNQTDPAAPLRIWIPGCSTGEEAYTMAILVREAFEKRNWKCNAQIFATDIDGDAIAAARLGVYPESVAGHVSSQYLKRYFVHEKQGWRVTGKIRESVVFAVQNLLGDAPFSNLDLISCRNLLIYLEKAIQKKVIELFHFALRRGGILVLGNSETIGYPHHLFENISKEHRIYRAIGSSNKQVRIPIQADDDARRGFPIGMGAPAPRKSMAQLMQTQLLNRFAPPAVMINLKNEIMNLFGSTDKYLRMPQGDPNMDLMGMVREGLRIKLRAAVHKAAKTNATVNVTGARVKREGRHYPVRFCVAPVEAKGIGEPLFLITFEDEPLEKPKTEPRASLVGDDETLVRQLETELMNTREDLQNTIEELETSNEELKASNEEMMSMNEELQSSNEELETSKEEMQSLNEELNTVNAELREKIDALESSNNDTINLMNSTEVAVIFLDMQTTIRRFTPSAKNLFNLIASDVGRPIGDLAQRFSDDELKTHVESVMDTLEPISKEVETEKGRWYIRRILPFRTQDNRVDGLVLIFSDVTETKQKQMQLRQAHDWTNRILGSISDGFFTFDNNLRVTYFNQAAEKLLGCKGEDVIGKKLFDAFPEARGSIFEEKYTQALKNKQPLAFETSFDEPPYENYYAVNVYPYSDGLSVYFQVKTEQKKAERALRKAHALLQQIIDNSLSLIVVKNRKGEYTLANAISERLIGCEKGEMIGKTDYDLFPKETADRLAEDDRKVFETGEFLHTEEQFQIGDRIYTFTTTKFPLHDSKGEFYAICGMATDITERLEMESALRENEKRFRAIFEQSAAGIATGTAEGRFLETNQTLCHMLGYTHEELSQMTVYDVTFPEDRERQMEKDKTVLEGKEDTLYLEKRFIHKDGHPVWAELASQVIRDEDGAIQYVIGVVVDVTERKRTEAALQKSKTLLDDTGRMARVGGWELDANTKAVTWTDETYRIHQVPPEYEPPLKKALEFYPSEDRKRLEKAIQRALDQGEPYDLELGFVSAKDKHRWVRTICRPEVVNGKTVKLSGVFQDITDRKKAEIALQDTLAEKETLLREIHHRVKNNMQVIVALLRMHARRVDNPDLTRIFNDCRDRITAMSLIHEALYQSDDLARIDFREYINKLCQNLVQVYNVKSRHITVEVGPCDVRFNMDQGVAVGMLIAELISNAFKHAFPRGQVGNVMVRMANLDAETVELVVADDGRGLPPDLDIRNPSSLGLRLAMGAATREMGASMDVDGTDGTRFTFRFKCR